MKLYDILTKTSESGIKLQRDNGSMPPGHNGPYHIDETPVRNTSHWLITFLKAYEISGDKRYKKAAKKATQYLLSEEARSHRHTFHHLKTDGKKCNGLIGQAWTVEALLKASEYLDQDELVETAAEVFKMHKFYESRGLWYIKEIDGRDLSIDFVFNHQLWFAAVGSMFDKNKYPEIHRKVKTFMENLESNLGIYKDGLIKHPVSYIPLNKKGIRRFLSKVKWTIFRKKKRKNCAGYHPFNLYGFALLKENYPEISFWDSEKFKKTIDFVLNKKSLEMMKESEYGFDYNVCGIEVAYSLNKFCDDKESVEKKYLEEQLNRNYDFEKNLLCKNTTDQNTLSARIYEATRLPNYVLKI